MDDEDVDITGLGLYTLDEDHNAIPATSANAWAKWWASYRRRAVKKETIGPFEVSTVFLGLDARAGMDPDRPLLFETMVFRLACGPLDLREQCSTWREAEEQHDRIAAKIRQTLNG